MRPLLFLMFVLLALGVAVPITAQAFQGTQGVDNYLPDDAMELRAHEISAQLRCVVCQSQSINDSNAFLARDMRNLVRERVAAGDSDEEIYNFFVERYGEAVLMKPNTKGINKILWGGPFVLLLIGAGFAIIFIRQQSRQAIASPAPLDAEEQKLLREALVNEDGADEALADKEKADKKPITDTQIKEEKPPAKQSETETMTQDTGETET